MENSQINQGITIELLNNIKQLDEDQFKPFAELLNKIKN